MLVIPGSSVSLSVTDNGFPSRILALRSSWVSGSLSFDLQNKKVYSSSIGFYQEGRQEFLRLNIAFQGNNSDYSQI